MTRPSRTRRKPHQVGVGMAAFVCCKGKFIFQKRQGAHGANTWAPPGGKLDFGESPEEGIVREVKEETDLDISSVKYIGYTNDVFTEDGLHYITLWYCATSTNQNAVITEPEKCLDQKWFSLDEVPKVLFLPTTNILADKKAVKILRELESSNT